MLVLTIVQSLMRCEAENSRCIRGLAVEIELGVVSLLRTLSVIGSFEESHLRVLNRYFSLFLFIICLFIAKR